MSNAQRPCGRSRAMPQGGGPWLPPAAGCSPLSQVCSVLCREEEEHQRLAESTQPIMGMKMMQTTSDVEVSISGSRGPSTSMLMPARRAVCMQRHMPSTCTCAMWHSQMQNPKLQGAVHGFRHEFLIIAIYGSDAIIQRPTLLLLDCTGFWSWGLLIRLKLAVDLSTRQKACQLALP